MFKTYSSLSSLVITSRWFATSRLVAPISVRLVYYIEFLKYHNFTKWKHFHRSPVDSPHKGQWPWALILSIACAWTNGWANNRDTGNLRCHHAHYDTAVMILLHINKLHLTSSYTYSLYSIISTWMFNVFPYCGNHFYFCTFQRKFRWYDYIFLYLL